MELGGKLQTSSQAPSQTLARGLDVLEQVASGDGGLGVIAARLGLSRTTVHRLASSLVERRYLHLTPRRGYSLGPKLLELGFAAREQIVLVRDAAAVMERLAAETGDAVLLAVRDGDDAVVVSCVPGGRRLAPMLRVGERLDVRRSAAGAALLMDGVGAPAVLDEAAGSVGRKAAFVASGLAFDEQSCAEEIVTIAAPVRGADGGIAAAIGIAMASPYRDEGTSPAARQAVLRAGADLSAVLGWRVADGRDGVGGTGAARELLGGTGGTGLRRRAASRMKRNGKAASAAATT